MKKIVLSIIIFLIFPVFVLANDILIGEVINQNGTDIDCDGKKVHLPYDTEVWFFSSDFLIDYKDDFGCIPHLKDYRIGDLHLIGDDEVVIVNDDTKLLNGPDLEFSYTSNRNLPKGTVLKVEYSYGEFAYVTYNNESGWILYDFHNDEADNRYAKLIINEVVIIGSDASIYTKDFGQVTGEVIKAHSMVHLYYGYDNWFYVNYNGKDVWINVDPEKVVYKNDSKKLNSYVTTHKSFETIDVYTGTKVNVPANARLDIAYQDDFFYNACGTGSIKYAYYDSYLVYLEGCIYLDNNGDSSTKMDTKKTDNNENASTTTKSNVRLDSKRALLYFIIFMPVGALLASSIFVFTKKGKNNK